MLLKKVVHRKPVPFRPHESEPNYLLCYVVETLECGHKLTVYPNPDPLVAVRRDCKHCGSAESFSAPTSPKKPVQSVRSLGFVEEKDKRAA